MASPDDINSTLKGIVTNISNEAAQIQALGTSLVTGNANLVAAIAAVATAIINVFPQAMGSFTLANATTTTISQTGLKSGGFPLWAPTNLTAALTVLNHGLYLSVVTAGSGFVVSTATGVASGSETFLYGIVNPA
jgi:hypothetical protein